MLLDANLLLYAVRERARHHQRAVIWLEAQLNGRQRVGFPWQSINAFLRISTHARAFERPLSPTAAWEQVEEWLAVPVSWILEPGAAYSEILGGLILSYDIRGNLIPDAALAALAVEHGVPLVSTDTDFARFSELRWDNPLQ
jgi:toxin-antitoxin system PIN domain toxin